MFSTHPLIKKFIALVFIMAVVLSASVCTASAATAGTISGVSNYSNGIKVTWNTSSTKSGYIIYRRAGSSSTWKKVKKITSKTTSNWTDTSVANGTKYTYKVCPYKGTKIYSTTATKKTYRLSTPSMTLDTPYAGAIRVTSNSNSSASGYQVKYSTSSSFSNAKTITVSGTKTLKKVLSGLTCGNKYYVKVRAFKTVSGTKYYSGYCSSKAITTTKPQTMYTTNISTTLYTKDSTSSNTLKVKYRTKVSMYGHYRVCSNGVWEKLKYDGKVYYVWLATGDTKFSKNGFANYKASSNTAYQNEVIDLALKIKDWPTEYAHQQSTGTKNANGKYGFDCSGLVSYIINSVVQKDCPLYYISYDLKAMYETNSIINTGYPSEVKATTVCEKIDLSKMQAGDVIFFDLETMDNRDGLNYDHCGIYLGGNEFIHSSTGWDGVTIMPLDGIYKSGFLKVIRFLPTTPIPAINEPYYTDAGGTTRVYSTTSTNLANITDTLATETPVTLQYTVRNGAWGYVSYADGKTGYILMEKLTNVNS